MQMLWAVNLCSWITRNESPKQREEYTLNTMSPFWFTQRSLHCWIVRRETSVITRLPHIWNMMSQLFYSLLPKKIKTTSLTVQVKVDKKLLVTFCWHKICNQELFDGRRGHGRSVSRLLLHSNGGRGPKVPQYLQPNRTPLNALTRDICSPEVHDKTVPFF